MMNHHEIETMIQRILNDDPSLVRKIGDTPMGAKGGAPSRAISYNKTLTAADTEYRIPFPTGTKMFSIRMRSTAYSWRYSYEQSRVGTPTEPYSTVPASAEYYEKTIDIGTGVSLYVASGTAAQVLECTFWV